MSEWSGIGAQRYESDARNTALSRGIQVASNAVAHTKGAYVELIASTAFDAQGIILFSHCSAARSYLVDVAVGAAAAEKVLVPDWFPGGNCGLGNCSAFFPVCVPIGTRLAARCQDASGGGLVRFGVSLLTQGFLTGGPLGRVTAYGVSTAASEGTEVDPGATANTKGSWVQLDAATANPMRWLVVTFAQNDNRSFAQVQDWLVDVGVGAGAAEKIVLPDLIVGSHLYCDGIGPPSLSLPVNIPAGSRLSVRAACSSNDATRRLLTVGIMGVD